MEGERPTPCKTGRIVREEEMSGGHVQGGMSESREGKSRRE